MYACAAALSCYSGLSISFFIRCHETPQLTFWPKLFLIEEPLDEVTEESKKSWLET